ncbi:MAG: hypothetical protein INQ03_10795 [Candidatus Heimdallarchaeota archaeon]|nr:hypothetical protein [Candidatus Heimdallarchaeota archaeon]
MTYEYDYVLIPVKNRLIARNQKLRQENGGINPSIEEDMSELMKILNKRAEDDCEFDRFLNGPAGRIVSILFNREVEQ